MADALEAAHEKALCTRLKPANVKINPDGIVKVLTSACVAQLGEIRQARRTRPR
jgi:hypothetical protein